MPVLFGQPTQTRSAVMTRAVAVITHHDEAVAVTNSGMGSFGTYGAPDECARCRFQPRDNQIPARDVGARLAGVVDRVICILRGFRRSDHCEWSLGA